MLVSAKASPLRVLAALGVVALATALVLMPISAHANEGQPPAQVADEFLPGEVTVTTEVRDTASATVFLASCPSGTTRQIARGSLDNGWLRAVFCKINGSSKVNKIWVEYEKVSGSTVTVRVGWRNSTNGGSDHHRSYWGSFQTVTINQSISTTWEYTGGIYPPIGYDCWRGIMEDQGTGFWITGIECTA